jgi:hypothetical protein
MALAHGFGAVTEIAERLHVVETQAEVGPIRDGQYVVGM